MRGKQGTLLCKVEKRAFVQFDRIFTINCLMKSFASQPSTVLKGGYYYCVYVTT
jgi:hypothetical protein